MAFEPGLKGRFFAATVALAVIFVGGYTFAVARFIEVVEVEFAARSFNAYLDTFVRAWSPDGSHAAVLPATLEAYACTSDDTASLPPALRRLAPGVHLEVDVDGEMLTVARRDVDGRRFVLTANSQNDPVEVIESELLRIALLVGCAALGIAALMALWLARMVTRPVQALAGAVSQLVPGQPRPALLVADSDSEIRMIAAAFTNTLDRYDEVVARERAFTRDASHELRTPLAVILTSLELLDLAGELPPETRLRAERIRTAAEQMHLLTEALLYLARPPEAHDEHAGTPDLIELVRTAIRLHSADGTGPAVLFEVGTPTPCTVRAPPGLVLCVLGNLLRNAQQHAGGGPVEVHLTASSLSVSDRGVGIASGLAPQVFEANVRGAQSSGEGLGLDLVKRICTRLGWRMELTTAEGVGSRFTLYFA